MARPWSSCRIFAVVLVPLLCSCLDLGVTVEFRTSTAGQVRIEALNDRLAQGLHFTPGEDRISWPVTRAEWQTLADTVTALSQAGGIPQPGTAQAAGLTLVSYAGTDEDLGFRTSVVLAFANARALEGLFAVFKQKLTLTQDLGKWKVTFVPQVPRVTAADAETRKLWTSLWGARTWTFGFVPPGQPRTERSVTLASLAEAQAPSEWTLSW